MELPTRKDLEQGPFRPKLFLGPDMERDTTFTIVLTVLGGVGGVYLAHWLITLLL